MATPLLGALISGALIVGLVTLFQFEAARGARLLEGLRAALDDALRAASACAVRVFSHLGAGVIRETAHFLFHKMLQLVLRLIHRAEARITALIRRNKRLARRAREEKTTRTALDEIAEHKAQIALTEEEKRRHREETLES